MTRGAPEQRVYLAVPYRERDLAEDAGALWDPQAKAWYLPPRATADQFEDLARYRVDALLEPRPSATAARAELAAALRTLGFVVQGEHPIMDGEHHRLRVEGDRRGERGGFYFAYLDGRPAGYARNHRTGQELRWKARSVVLDAAELTKVRAEAAQKLERRRVEEVLRHELCASALLQRLRELSAATQPTPYQARKGLAPHPGVYTDAQGSTIVPGYDADGKLWTLQTIDASGEKRFAQGARKHRSMHPIGGFTRLAQAEVIVIAEGYATAATLAQLLGRPAVAAFDAGNLLPVAEALHAKHPHKPVLIVGDDDRGQEQAHGRNPGREKAEEAAKAVGGKAVFPIFAPGEQRERPKDFTDFNDLAMRSVLGRDGAQCQLRHVYEHLVRTDRARAAEHQRCTRGRSR